MRAPLLNPLLLPLLVACGACGCGQEKSTRKVEPVAQAPASERPASADTSAGTPTFTASTPAAQRGQALYDRMCAVCHGSSGEGYKADQAPAIAHPEFLASASDDFLRTAILEGRSDTTMSAWGRHRGGPLTRDDANDVIAFIRSWQRGPRAALDERPLQGDAARGGRAFERECTRCHGADGVGGPNVHVGNPELLDTASDGFLRHAIARGRADAGMPAYATALGAQGVDDVIAFLRAAASRAAPSPPPAKAKPPPVPLGPVPLNPKGPEPEAFNPHPGTTKADVVHAQLARGARMALLDARAPSDYLREHIEGAVSVPFYDPAPYFEQLPKDAWLVCYCACPHAESRALAQKLLDQGFTKVTVLDEGLGVWKSKGYGVQAGTPGPQP